MNDYTSVQSPVYSVDVKPNGVANFSIKDDEITLMYQINLKDKGIWEGNNGYSSPHPERHFICHENGQMIVLPSNYKKLIYLDYTPNKPEPKVFIRARQWEWDQWMSKNFPDSGNAKVYKLIKNFIKNK